MTDAIIVSHLKKSFDSLVAVNDVSFSVKQGTCFGLLGPNGAGKTTTLEMIEGLLKPDHGEINYPHKPDHLNTQEFIGIQFQNTALQDHITVYESLSMFADLYSNREHMDSLITLCALQDYLQQNTQKLSGGQRQRLLLALALIHNPQVIYLDEPTTGLDPQSRRNFWELVKKIKSQGKTLLLTTHYMDEAQILCDEIAIMDRGTIIAQGAPTQLLKQHFSSNLIRLPSTFLDKLQTSFKDRIDQSQDYIELASENVELDIQALLRLNIPLQDLYIHKPNLEDLFISLTGHQLRG
ncbi:ABC transporter ATP-binding protein [Pleionea litopenaei]|uniref:ABC transporter ATP-binding protein n=1 Tax=Pleionea litopenaei TaxID=3070815 RepID=A0AA51X6K9_9GAMM|nr:ABC transporter ATP-binding protein [Pleionea sp. HL-JVS1]WMS86936.1 ABC transporter ATP-binding protein [Pleionea sp. HL-JVS1]